MVSCASTWNWSAPEEPFQLLSDMVESSDDGPRLWSVCSLARRLSTTLGMKPIIFGIPVIGFMGYVVAFALGVWIVIDIYLKGRKTKKR